MVTTHRVSPEHDIDVIASAFPIPGYGQVPINAFVLHGTEPVLVDTGVVVESDAFMTALEGVIDPTDLAWIWLTHTDLDHIGSLRRILDLNPDVRVLTTFLSVGILSLADPLPMDRVHLVTPGQTVEVGGRKLTAIRPPTFDNPATVGFLDHASGALISSDCFGALLADVPERAADITESDLLAGQHTWASIDAPWLATTDREAYGVHLRRVRDLSPSVVLSSHLPVADGAMLERLLSNLAGAPDATPFTGPDQQQLEAMLGAMTHG